MRRSSWAVALAALLAGACSTGPATRTGSRPSVTAAAEVPPTGDPTTTAAAPTTVTTTTTPTTTTTTTGVPATASTDPAPAVAVGGFTATVSAVTAADLPASWRPGCPVGPDRLRLVRLTYWGFDDQPHTGSLVVDAAVTDSITEVFRRLYEQRFPIRRMELVDAFGGDDDASMAADNTSAFNCRYAVASGPPRWSAHAYGRAIDVNPVENPYVLGRRVLPPAGADYVDRSRYRPGMAIRGGPLTSAFAAAGWSWGGNWSSPDYQHFSVGGS